MNALSYILDTTTQAGAESETGVFPLIEWQSKSEQLEDLDGTSTETEVSRQGFPPWDLTYPELTYRVVRGPLTGFDRAPVIFVEDKSYDSPVPITSFPRERVIANLERVAELLVEINESFEDKISRQILFFEVKDHLNKLWDIDFPKNDYFLQAVSLLEDSLIYTKSEDLSREQVEGLLKVVEICKRITLSIDDVRECGRILRNKKIVTFPTLS